MSDQAMLGGGMAEQMGIMNALRTGNVILDMMIAMTIPVLFKLIFDWIASGSNKIATGELTWRNFSIYRLNMCERVIEHKTTEDRYGDSTSSNRDERNNVLVKAIMLFLDDKKIGFHKCNVTLTSMAHATTTDEEDSSSSDEDVPVSADERSPAGKLRNYKLAQKAPNFIWQSVGIHGGKESLLTKEMLAKGEQAKSGAEEVELRVEEKEKDKGEKGEKTIKQLRYRLRARSSHAIDAFIHEAYHWYLGELRKQEDNSRYLYEMQTGGGSSKDGESSDTRTYKRYKLSDQKTFQSLFFQEKAMLLAILEHFKNKTGKYGISGYPHKLG